MLQFFKNLIPDRHPIRLFYHQIMAFFAMIFWGNPSKKLRMIAVTGTSGKTTTSNIMHYLIQNSGEKCGLISGIVFKIGEKEISNETLRTTLRPWQTQKLLRKMVRANCKYCVIEVSSHAIDQNRVWGVIMDTVVLTNVSDNEHLDYHKNFAEYVRTKTKLFRALNFSYRKPNIPKISVLNRDDENYEIFEEFSADRKWSFSLKQRADLLIQNLELKPGGASFRLQMPNHTLAIETPLIGQHNVENLAAAVAGVVSSGISVQKIPELLANFRGVSGRLESLKEHQPFSVVVDFSYKPSALEAVIKTLRNIVKGNIIVVFGGCYKRAHKNLSLCGEILNKQADEIILTTDDPEDDDPKRISNAIKTGISREEGAGFFEIEDRYEAIRYAIYTAENDDCVLIAGRGHEKIQTIGNHKIPFEDRTVAQEILQFAQKQNLIASGK